MSVLGRLPLPIGVVLVAAVTGGVIVLGSYLGLGVLSLALLAIPVVLAVFYLREYSRKELRPKPVAPRLSRRETVNPTAASDAAPPADPEPHLTLFDDGFLETSFVSAGAIPPSAAASPAPTDV